MDNRGVTISHEGAKALLRSQGVRDELTRRARQVLAEARSTAPVASGDYRDSLHIVQDTTDRAAVRVVSDDPVAILVESRTGTLARSLDAAGGA